ncbi:Transcriptional regulator LytR [bioreactor metagenome]|uniref:Transcriptional regulator LytR n=1 Tax=bioreactor metagenome TaxID=1076179 RepID=A0A645CIB1_9ZZZZ
MTIPQTIKIRDRELNKCFTLKKGSIKLNGIQTLEYLRYRSDGKGDIGRVYRQQEFIKDLQSSFLKLENVPLIPKAYLAIRDDIKTDMDASDMASYFISGYKLRNNFEYHTLKGYSKFIDKVSYYILYQSSIKSIKDVLK